MSRTAVLGLLVFGSLLALTVWIAFEQQDDGGRRGTGESGVATEAFTLAEFRRIMLMQVQQRIGATAEQVEALRPELEEVLAAHGELGDGPFAPVTTPRQTGRDGRVGLDWRRVGGAGRPGVPVLGAPQPAVVKAEVDLRQALESDASDDDLTARLAVLRDARARARAQMAEAQEKLKAAVTPKQEAEFVLMGLID
jgi:hypothetical protein